MALKQESQNDAIAATAASLVGTRVLSCHPATGGGNNRVFRVETTDRVYAVKYYPSQKADPRDRLHQEFTALTFMNGHHLTCIPDSIACDVAAGCAAYEWIDGTAPGPISDKDVDAMVSFSGALADLVNIAGAQILAPASASCFSGRDVMGQIAARMGHLKNASDDPALHAFLDDAVAAAAPQLETRARALYATVGRDFDAQLAVHERTLSPSDFGFHNAIRRADGTLVFLDFEYFGWDDPVKMISDAVWHPGSKLPGHLALQYSAAARKIFADRDGDAFNVRFDALFPLFGLIWCLILLNEFIPERWARRVAAGAIDAVEIIRARQLAAARELLEKVTSFNHD